MTFLTFDTETTALRPGQICQLAYIVDDGGNAFGRSLFFAVDEMSASSEAVHGFSVECLARLSGGKRFADHIDEVERDFSRADVLAGHNVAADLRFLRTEFERAGRRLPECRSFCTMNAFTRVMMLTRAFPKGYPKPPKLTELTQYLGITDERVRVAARTLFGDGETAHDARYDAAATYLCIRGGIEKGLIDSSLFKCGA